MTRDQLLDQLRAAELRLRSAEVQSLFATQDQEVRDNFVSLRNQLSGQIAQLSNAQLEDIANELSQLSPDLEAGITNLQTQLDRLDSAIAIINAVSSVLGLVGRVIGLF
jgi:biopolymer transport protein ExbB/TolQ